MTAEKDGYILFANQTSVHFTRLDKVVRDDASMTSAH